MNQAWILLFLPLAVAAVNQLVLRRSPIVPWFSTASAFTTLTISLMLIGFEGAASFDWASVGGLHLRIGILLDRLSTGMMVVVTGVGALVHLFSLAYMRDDAAKARYFTCLQLFMFSMTGIVLASDFIMTFIFWELVGLSSYLLIGHWFAKASAADAAKKAFLCNRVGDFGFLIGILLLWSITGTFAFASMEIPTAVPTTLLTATLLCIFCGAVGKSAQLPLHVWLPDAMEGPTPVSALIHAATMVAAGVYMLFRLQISLGAEAFDNLAGDVIAWTGGLTALAAALMATQQDDIKRVLAYSTLSQLGYMVMAVGLLAGEAGMFHLFTHAWFKALLFLGAGAVIHACHHEQDIWKLGGLIKKMPLTAGTFLVGCAALIAVPFTSGFFSKELILEAAHSKQPILFWIAAAVAVLTPFYMTRLGIVAFFGGNRSDSVSHAREVGPLMAVPLLVLAVPALIAGNRIAHGFAPTAPAHAGEFHLNFLFWVSVAALVIGSGAALLLYLGKPKDPLCIPVLRERFYIDRVYDRVIVRRLQDTPAAIIHFIDEWIINGLLVDGISRAAASLGGLLRRMQSGQLQAHTFAFGIGVLLVIYFTVFF
jgi:NADH-quinone oxidoreductase subunit L